MVDSSIAHYQITAKLGQGGMGEVYRATDTKLDREVAIKVLPEAVAGDKERLARFDREAKVLAQLNHPNIAGVHGLEHSGNTQALVLELVEGEDLSEQLKRGPLPVDEALEICKQIAEALEAAHDKGIIHRDLKPGNIKLTGDGKVKVLDFGLAKALSDESDLTSSTDQEVSPTITDVFTKPGTILGTAAYMSPEQARGKHVDERTDIWAFGCVLFECLTGKKACQGEDVTDTLATIIKGEPNWAAVPKEAPSIVQLLLRKCLTKDRRRRLQDAGDARIDLEQSINDPTHGSILGSPVVPSEMIGRTTGRGGLRLASGFLGAIFIAGISWWLKPSPPNQLPEPRHVLQVLSSKSGDPQSIAISPNGQKIVYELVGGGPLVLYSFATGKEETIPGTEMASRPFFSPDSKSIGFYTEANRLFSLAVVENVGEPFKTVGPKGGATSAAWGPDWKIAFSYESDKSQKVQKGISILDLKADSESNISQITELREDEESHRFPQWLPDGKHILFMSSRNEDELDQWNAELVHLESKQRVTLKEDCTYARYFENHLLCMVNDVLYAYAFDPKTFEMSNDRKLLRLNIAIKNNHSALYDISATGTLVFVTGSNKLKPTVSKFQWIDLQGGLPPTDVGTLTGFFEDFDLSPDDRTIALVEKERIKLYDLENQEVRRLDARSWHRGSGEDRPIWHPSGNSILYRTWREDEYVIRKKTIPFGSPQIILEDLESTDWPETIYDDGTQLLFIKAHNGNWPVVYSYSMGATMDTIQETELVSPGLCLSISADNQWLAYASGPNELSLTYNKPGGEPFPLASITLGLDIYPKWSSDNRRVIYYDDNSLWAIEPRIQNDIPDPGRPKKLTDLPRQLANLMVQDLRANRIWDLDSKQERALVLVSVEEQPTAGPIMTGATTVHVTFDFASELRETKSSSSGR